MLGQKAKLGSARLCRKRPRFLAWLAGWKELPCYNKGLVVWLKMIKHLPGMLEALGSILSTTKIKKPLVEEKHF